MLDDSILSWYHKYTLSYIYIYKISVCVCVYVYRFGAGIYVDNQYDTSIVYNRSAACFLRYDLDRAPKEWNDVRMSLYSTMCFDRCLALHKLNRKSNSVQHRALRLSDLKIVYQ